MSPDTPQQGHPAPSIAAAAAAVRPSDLSLAGEVTTALKSHLPRVAEQTVAAITAEVPGYVGALSGEMGDNIERAVQMALGGFLNLATRSEGSDPGTPLQPALEAAYALGRGEARSGRSMDALLAAYRVGARVSWRELARVAVASELPAASMAQFAELVFAYIDELSAASVAGHADELATTGRVRQRYRERLAQSLLSGAPADAVVAAAERADWEAPSTLTAVILPEGQLRSALSRLDPATLRAGEEPPGLDPSANLAVLLVPDAHGPGRRALLLALAGRRAVVGPARPWLAAQASYTRALRAQLRGTGRDGSSSVDTEDHLAELVLTADPEALEDLRARVLAPLADQRPAAQEKLRETLRAWLLHQGRREDVAAELFVHPQTVRYRLGQLRELYGDLLTDPATVLDLTLALGVAAGPAGGEPAVVEGGDPAVVDGGDSSVVDGGDSAVDGGASTQEAAR